MTFLIGTDEAGYGPNLGPLVVSATTWQVPDSLAAGDSPCEDLYASLGDCVSREPQRRDSNRNRTVAPVPMTDSKKLYSAGGSLEYLELGVFVGLGLLDCRPRYWQDIWCQFDPTASCACAQTTWFRDYQEALPIDLDSVDLQNAEARFAKGLREANIALRKMQARVVFPEEFNQLVDKHDNKGTALSELTLELVRDALETVASSGRVLIQCDKHGGRNKYGSLLQHFFPDEFIEVRQEGRERSVYRWGPESRRVEIRFVAKGENFLPSALASMIAKYLRELSMRAFNQFWCGRVPNLKPTAGYPGDAMRFKTEIEALQRQLGFSDRILWRNR